MNKQQKVVFRWWEGAVIALFPEEPADYAGYDCESYMHVGQHGASSDVEIVRNSRPATPDEYAGLKRELERLGYRLEVRQRITRQMFQQRRATAAYYRTAAVQKATQR